MLPVVFDLSRIPVLLAGRGEALAKRRRQLEEYGAVALTVLEGIPAAADIAAHRLVMLAGLPKEEAGRVAQACRTAGRLLNVEDVNELCDFYFTANVRRGDLVISVSTGGHSPTLAQKIRDWIAAQFSEEWEKRVTEIGQLRRQWKSEGRNLSSASHEHIARKQWLA
ncbi:MAG: hypothetical protein KGJ06_04905 [Pseudomonadota bacterium]|nr:hypothetical protein [Pseudomonadota bacterium]